MATRAFRKKRHDSLNDLLQERSTQSYSAKTRLYLMTILDQDDGGGGTSLLKMDLVMCSVIVTNSFFIGWEANERANYSMVAM